MSDVEDFLARACRLERQASEAQGPDEQDLLLALAAEWRRLAAERAVATGGSPRDVAPTPQRNEAVKDRDAG